MHAFYGKKVIFEMDILEALIDWLSIYIYFWEVSIFGKLSRNPVLQNSHHIWEATLKSELIFWRNSSPRLGLLRYRTIPVFFFVVKYAMGSVLVVAFEINAIQKVHRGFIIEFN